MGRLTAIVLGSAAGGGFPQWNCRCAVCRLAWAGDPRVRARTQASLAVSGRRRELDPAQRLSRSARSNSQRTPALHPRAGTRGSPIEAVVLTGAEIDQVTGLLSLRERQPFTICATAATLAALAGNPMFDALAPDVVTRRALVAGRVGSRCPAGCRPSCSSCPARRRSTSKAKIPRPRSETAANVGVEISAGGRAPRLRPGRRRGDARAARAPGARRRHAVRRHAVHATTR